MVPRKGFFLVAVVALWSALLVPPHPACAAGGDECRLKAQLVWGTDGQKPKDAEFEPLEPRIRQKLQKVFKWKNYFEINSQQIALTKREAKRLKMSSKCELDVKWIDDATIEVKLYGEGKWTKTIKQSVKALEHGELAVIAGDDKDHLEDAWFVVLSVPPPPP